MPVTDRRLIPRRRVKMPLRFRLVADRPARLDLLAGGPARLDLLAGGPARLDLLAGGSAPVLTGESLNLSERGVYFLTDRLLDVGAQMELFLPVGYDSAARSATELRCTARVVHCEACPDTQIFRGIHVGAHPEPSRTIGVGVFIESFDPPGVGP